jgi:adenosylcobinamide-GDP ribazoletransferase
LSTVTYFWLALGFLTTLPTRPVPYQPDGLTRAAVWFPVVGLLLGLLLAGTYALSALVFPASVVAVLVLAAWAALTGGLHLDGLADCCDGLLASVARERRLEIMRDPRTGSFAVIGLVLVLLLKAAAISSLRVPWPALVLALVGARWLVLLAARRPPARTEGLGSALVAGLTPQVLITAAVLPVLVTVAALWWDGRSLLGVVFAAVAAFAVIRLAQSRIGGVTGDVFGAVVELGETAVLVAFALRPL